MLPTNRPPTHPGVMFLEEFVRPLQLSLAEVARRLQMSYPRLHDIVNGRRPVTPDTALRFARGTGMPVRFWLQLQLDFEAWILEHEEPSRELQRISPFAETAP